MKSKHARVLGGAASADAVTATALSSERLIGNGHSHLLKVGAKVVLEGKDLVYLGATGNGRYAFVLADEFGGRSGSTPRIRTSARLDTEIKLGLVRPETRRRVDRRGCWTRFR